MLSFSTWMPHLYSISLMVVLPVGLLFAVPMPVVDQTYLGSSLCYVFVSVWTLVQTFAAWRFGRNSRDPRPATPPGESTGLLRSGTSEESTKLACLIPAYLNNKVGILDDTLASYCDVKYRGSVVVLVVFNSKGDMGETERALMEKWDAVTRGQEENIRISIAKNGKSTSKAENVNHGMSLIPLMWTISPLWTLTISPRQPVPRLPSKRCGLRGTTFSRERARYGTRRTF